MSFTNIYIHAVWATKNRDHLLTSSRRTPFFRQIKKNALEKGIYIDHINGYTDHVHALISLRNTQSIADCMQIIKGGSSFWANECMFFGYKINWAKGYYAVSVSKSQLAPVRLYIQNQEKHHSKKTFNQECQEFVDIYGFEHFED